MLNALLYTFILYHILFLLICDAFMCVHCIVFYSSATEALINNNNNNNCDMPVQWTMTKHNYTRTALLNLRACHQSPFRPIVHSVWRTICESGLSTRGPLPMADEGEALSRGLSTQWLATDPPEVSSIAASVLRT